MYMYLEFHFFKSKHSMPERMKEKVACHSGTGKLCIWEPQWSEESPNHKHHHGLRNLFFIRLIPIVDLFIG